MFDDWNQIPIPSQEEKDRQIALILDQGIPTEEILWQTLEQTFRMVRWQGLFFGAADCIFLSVLVTLLCLVPVWGASQQTGIGPAAFLFSPVLYGALSFFTGWKEFQSGTLEWLRTCRVSHRAVTALRMLVFGGAAVTVSVPGSVLLWELTGREQSLLWTIAISVSGVCLYGVLSLYCLRLEGTAGLAAAPAAWALLAGLPLAWEKAAQVIYHIPAAVFCLIAAGAAGLYLMELGRYCRRRIGGKHHTFS